MYRDNSLEQRDEVVKYTPWELALSFFHPGHGNPQKYCSTLLETDDSEEMILSDRGDTYGTYAGSSWSALKGLRMEE